MPKMTKSHPPHSRHSPHRGKPNKDAAPLLPLGAWVAGFGLSLTVLAPAAAAGEAPPEKSLPVVKAQAREEERGKDDMQATETRLAKGKQELRDIPQSVTVVTARVIEDRKLDTLKDVLKVSSGISFLAAEGGEEDIRLRGFALQTTGDVFVDGMRDPAFYDRDSFNYDRVEVIRGSASMLFGRGSTGGGGQPGEQTAPTGRRGRSPTDAGEPPIPASSGRNQPASRRRRRMALGWHADTGPQQRHGHGRGQAGCGRRLAHGYRGQP